MSSNSQYISVRETAQTLGITEKKVMDLIEAHELQAYRIADKFLRLKRVEVLQLRTSGNIEQETTSFEYTSGEKLKDFFYFNIFYILSLLIAVSLLYVIFFVQQ